MKLWNVFIIVFVSVLMVFTAAPAHSYVPDDLDFAPMGEGQGHVAQGFSPATYTIPSINYKMAYIQSGTFMMGSPSNEPKRNSNERRHKVTLTKGFYMGTTEMEIFRGHIS
ncbi:MAG: hypothetical protein U9N38_00155 [Thermodesulfobacteriota bacterium]|nr:hypothetical protein [Thermodesulfobacteriota bacterium]